MKVCPYYITPYVVNISCPETGRNKIVELQNEEKMGELIDKKILLQKGSSMFRFKKGYHRRGVRTRKLVRGCIVSPISKSSTLKSSKEGLTPSLD